MIGRTIPLSLGLTTREVRRLIANFIFGKDASYKSLERPAKINGDQTVCEVRAVLHAGTKRISVWDFVHRADENPAGLHLNGYFLVYEASHQIWQTFPKALVYPMRDFDSSGLPGLVLAVSELLHLFHEDPPAGWRPEDIL